MMEIVHFSYGLRMRFEKRILDGVGTMLSDKCV